MTEEEKSASKKAIKDLTLKLAYFRTRSSPKDTIVRREPEGFAEQWVSNIWRQLVRNSNNNICNFEDAISSALQELDQLDDEWDKARMSEDGKEWTGAQLFAFQIDKLNDKMQPIIYRPRSVSASAKDDQAYHGSDTSLHNPAADAVEAMLDEDHPHKDLTPEQRQRRSNRQALREHILDICKLLKPVDQTMNLDAVALAADWEKRLWNTSSKHSDGTATYNEDFEAAEEDLQEWKTYWDSTEGDCLGNRTGRQFFVEHVQKFHANEPRHATYTGSLDELSASAVSATTSCEDKEHQNLRNVLAEQLENMRALLPPSHNLSNFHIAQIVRTWESQNWTAACQQGFDINEHVEHTEAECEELGIWAEYRDDYPDEDLDMTGEARFSEFIRQRLGSGVSATPTQP
jgi:hypothetical protein